MPGRRFSVWAFVCVKMPTRLSCFIMPAGGSSTMSASSWRVMDRGRKESHKSSLLRHKSNPSLFSYFALVPCFLDFMSCFSLSLFPCLSKVFQTHLFSFLLNTFITFYLYPPERTHYVRAHVDLSADNALVALWDSCNLKSSAENRLWIAAWICCNKSQTRSGPSAISQAPGRDYSVQKPSAHTSSQPKTTGCIS